jgi:hypothetical protein
MNNDFEPTRPLRHYFPIDCYGSVSRRTEHSSNINGSDGGTLSYLLIHVLVLPTSGNADLTRDLSNYGNSTRLSDRGHALNAGSTAAAERFGPNVYTPISFEPNDTLL